VKSIFPPFSVIRLNDLLRSMHCLLVSPFVMINLGRINSCFVVIDVVPMLMCVILLLRLHLMICGSVG
jgi:hypothetical protein